MATQSEKYNLADLDEDDYDTVLAEDIEFTGSIQFKRPFMIKGSVAGEIQSTSDLTIEPQAIVKANIHADRVIVRGKVLGNIMATTSVHVYANGTLNGDVTAPEVILDPGCFFSGICTMTKNQQ